MDSPGRLAGGSCAVSEEAERPVSSSQRCLQATQLVTSPSSPADPRQLHPTVFCRTTGQATPELDVSGEWKHPAVPGGCCPRLSTFPDPSLVAQIPAAGRTGPSHPGLPLPFTLPCLPPGPHSPPFRLSRLPGADALSKPAGLGAKAGPRPRSGSAVRSENHGLRTCTLEERGASSLLGEPGSAPWTRSAGPRLPCAPPWVWQARGARAGHSPSFILPLQSRGRDPSVNRALSMIC